MQNSRSYRLRFKICLIHPLDPPLKLYKHRFFQKSMGLNSALLHMHGVAYIDHNGVGMEWISARVRRFGSSQFAYFCHELSPFSRTASFVRFGPDLHSAWLESSQSQVRTQDAADTPNSQPQCWTPSRPVIPKARRRFSSPRLLGRARGGCAHLPDPTPCPSVRHNLWPTRTGSTGRQESAS
ncbi:hypothetical protein GQ55_6G052200 [Panicum hallii var. hallii]|uniref:Uncharacterized protein n=1 Tax=Panicum hallii var. hallii TaxID=1504633 RepID=A0A2T7D464_9POAL|nr:hypothetical protein GQ55_6G052200 [Panicum hallii var. hallii]